LAAKTPGNNVYRGNIRTVYLIYIAEMEHIGEVLFRDRYRKWFYIRSPYRLYSKPRRRQLKRARPVE
jgi:hypothetical protein